MGVKLLILVLFLSVVCKMMFGKWPWSYIRGPSARQQAEARARTLLGVKADADHAGIVAAHKRLIAQVHPDKGGSNAQVYEADAARDLLLSSLPDESPKN